MIKKVNAFQLRGLRKIIGAHTTYMNRGNTNEFVIKQAEAAAYGNDPNRSITLFSDMYWNKREKLATHIMRTQADDPLRQLTYQPNTATRADIGRRRIGGPRQNWIQHTNKHIWKEFMQKTDHYTEETSQDTQIFNYAQHQV